ncbi:MAG: hypothetical protein RLZZ631_1551 [Cyanobacteriota bacterium]|jgi:hypothetical protein
MARSKSTQGPHGEGPGGLCSSCGGSGVLRTDSAAYRTCLECLGQGQTPVFETVFGFPDPVQPPGAEPCQRLPKGVRAEISASTSGAR